MAEISKPERIEPRPIEPGPIESGPREPRAREPQPPDARQPATSRPLWIFMGERGLRAGWRMLLFLLFVAVFLAGMWMVLSRLLRGHRTGEMSPLLQFAQGLPQVIAVFGAAALLARIERRPLLAAPFRGAAALPRFLSGVLWGLLSLSALVLSLWHSHLLVFSAGASLQGISVVTYGLSWAGLFFLVALFEESLFRGFLQSILADGIGFWPAALLLAALFGAVHLGNKGESQVGIFAAALVGLLFALSLWYTGTLWWAIGFHAAWDWAQSFLYGTADSGVLVRGHLFTEHPSGPALLSGGNTGPEGSLYIFPLLLLLLLGAWLWWRRRAHLWQPDAPREANV